MARGGGSAGGGGYDLQARVTALVQGFGVYPIVPKD